MAFTANPEYIRVKKKIEEQLKIEEEQGVNKLKAQARANAINPTAAVGFTYDAAQKAALKATGRTMEENQKRKAVNEQVSSAEKNARARQAESRVTADGFGEWLGKQAQMGIGNMGKSVWGTINAVEDILTYEPENDVLKTIAKFGRNASPTGQMINAYKALTDRFGSPVDYMNQKALNIQEFYTQRALESTESKGGGLWKYGGDFVDGAVNMIPNAVLTLMTQGMNQAGNAIQAGQSVLNSIVKQAANNPSFWLSMTQTLGNDYEEALSKGAGQEQAALTSIVTSALNAGIEVGGGIEQLPAAKGKSWKDTIFDWAKSAFEEGREEAVQGLISGSMAKSTYDPNKELYSVTNQDAVINPKKMAEEFGLGMALGGFVSGGQMAAGAAMNSLAQRFETVPYGGGRTDIENKYDKDSGIKLEKDFEDYPYSQQTVLEDYINYSNSKIRAFVNKVISGKAEAKEKIYLNDVTSKAAERIREITGNDVSGFKVALDTRIVEHIIKRHGKNGSSDHSMSGIDDFERIQYVIDNFDNIEHGGTSSAYTTVKENGKTRNADTVVYSKKINGTFYVVEAAPITKAKTLNIVSAYIKKKTAQVSNVKNPEETSETPSVQAFDDSIPYAGGNVKSGNRLYEAEGMSTQRFGPVPYEAQGRENKIKYSIGYTTDNECVAIIDKNILDGVKKEDYAAKTKEAISKFKPAIPVSGRLVRVTRKTANEYTNSKNANWLKHNDNEKYVDKLNAAGHLDEILLASTNYINEDLEHERSDNIKEFARGEVLLQIGDNKYDARVIVGFTDNNEMLLYDIVDINNIDFNLKRQQAEHISERPPKTTSRRNEQPADSDSISYEGGNVKSKGEERVGDRGEIGKDFIVEPDSSIYSNETAIRIITDGLGKEGKANYNTAYENEIKAGFNGTEAEFLRNYNRFYIAGMNGGKISDVPVRFSDGVTHSTKKTAFEAGKADRMASLDRKYKARNEAVIRDGGLIRNHNTENLNPKMETILDRLGKLFGVTVEIQDKVIGADGKEKNGSYSNGEVELSYDKMIAAGDINKAVNFVIGHEIGHRVQELAPKEFERFKNIAVDIRLEGDKAKSIHEYADTRGLTYDEAVDEIVCDLLGRSDFAQRAALEQPALAERIKNWIRDILDSLGIKKYSDNGLYRNWEKACYKAKKQAELNRKNPDGQKSSDVVKYSIIQLDDGKRYVQADEQVIKSKNPNDWEREIIDYVNNTVRKGQDVVIPMDNGESITITGRTAWKLGDKGNYSDDYYLVKGNASGVIDEIVQISKYKTQKIPLKEHKNGFALNGFEYRTAYFRDVDGKYYRLWLSVGINENNKEAYNIGKINEIPFPVSGSKAQKETIPHDTTLSQNKENVNSNDMQKLKKYSDGDLALLTAEDDSSLDKEFENDIITDKEQIFTDDRKQLDSVIMQAQIKQKNKLGYLPDKGYAYTNDYFVMFSNADAGEYKFEKAILIDGNEDLIDYLREVWSDGKIERSSKNIISIIEDFRSGRGSGNRNNDFTQKGRTGSGDDRLYRREQGGRPERYSWGSDKNNIITTKAELTAESRKQLDSVIMQAQIKLKNKLGYLPKGGYAYTNDYFVIFSGEEIGEYKMDFAVWIDGNEDLIDYLREVWSDGKIERGTKNIISIIEDFRSGRGSGNRNNDFTQKGRTGSGDDRLYRREQGGRPERYSHGNEPNSSRGNKIKYSDGDLAELLAEDVRSIQSIGRKSVNDFSSEDIKKTQKFAQRYFKEMGIKSPFFKAWFGDWRANDRTAVKIAARKGSTRGIVKNADTGWNIQVSGKVFNETAKQRNTPANIAYHHLDNLNEIIENAVLLDSVSFEENNKSPNSFMMHSLYVLSDSGQGVELIKLYVDEIYTPNSSNTIKRAYKLNGYSKIQLKAGSGLGSNAYSTLNSTGNTYTVSDLFNIVKQNDKNFNPKSAGRVVNEDGTPKVMYYGDEKGIYFTSRSLNDSQIYGGRAVQVYLNIKNPYMTFRNLSELMKKSEGGYYELQKKMREQGYDGLLQYTKNGDIAAAAVFDSRQIKSAADNIGTFDAGNPDIRYSEGDLAELMAENKTLKSRNKTLEKRIEYYKGQLKRTKPFTPDEQSISRMVRKLAKGYTGRVNLGAELKEAYVLINKHNTYVSRGGNEQRTAVLWEKVEDKINDIGMEIVKNTLVRNDSSTKLVQDVRKYLKSVKIAFPQSNRGDFEGVGGFNDFRKRNLGRMTISDSGVPVDVVYDELNSMYGEIFPKEIDNPTDQLLYLGEFFDKTRAVFENPYDADLDDAASSMAVEIFDELLNNVPPAKKTVADKMAEEMEKIIAEETAKKERALERIKKQRETALQEIADLKKQRADEWKRRSSAREDKTERKKLITIMNRVKRLYEHGGARTGVVIEEEKLKLLKELDLISVSMTEKTLDNLTDLRQYYDELKKRENFVPDAMIEKELARLEKKSVNELELEDVRSLTAYFLHIEHELRTKDRLINSQDKRNIYTQGEEVIRNIRNSKGAKKYGIGKNADAYITGVLNPIKEIRRLTGYIDNDPLYNRAIEVRDGEVDKLDYEMRAANRFKKWTDNRKFMNSISGKDAEFESFSIIVHDRTGAVTGRREIRLTRGMMISLFLHNMNSTNQRHMAYGGVTIPNETLYKKGEFNEAYNSGEKVYLSPKEIKKITDCLTAEELKYAYAVYDYFNEFSKKEINAVSTELYGYEKAAVKDYFPIYTDKNFLKSEFEGLMLDGTLENAGFMKERQGNAAPIMLDDVTSVLEKSIRIHAKFTGLAIPVRNFTKIWNVSAGITQEDYKRDKYGHILDINGNIIDDAQQQRPAMGYSTTQGYVDSVKNAMADKWGERAKKYIDDMMRDLQFGRKAADGPIIKALQTVHGGYVRAAMALNFPVAVNQAASYPVAAQTLGYKALAKGLKNFGKVDLELIAKYSPLQWSRNRGEFDTTLADVMAGKENVMDRALRTKYLNWMADTDAIVTRKLWKASEYYILDNRKDLQIGSDEFYRAAAQIYNKTILDTQPGSMTMTRPSWLRSDSVTSMLLPFQSELMKNSNMIYDAVENMNAKKRQLIQQKGTQTEKQAEEALKNAVRNAVTTITSQLVGQMVFSFVVGIARIALGGKSARDRYKDEEGKLTAKSVLQRMLYEFVLNSLTPFPFMSDAADFIIAAAASERYYGSEFIPLGVVGDILTELLSLSGRSFKLAGGECSMQEYAFEMYGLMEKVSQAFGIPLKNIVNISTSIAGHVIKASTDNEYIQQYETQKLYSALTGKSRDDNGNEKITAKSGVYDVLYRAFANGNRQGYDHIIGDLIDRGVNVKDIESALNSRSKKDDEFDYHRTLGMYAGLSQNFREEKYEEYLDRTEELGIKEEDLKKGIDIIESGKPYKQMAGEVKQFLAGTYFNDKQEEFFNGLVHKKYDINALSKKQYEQYQYDREEIYSRIIDDFIPFTDGNSNNRFYDKAEEYAEKTALEKASDGEYVIVSEWINTAKKSEQLLRLSEGKFIKRYLEYGAALYSDKAIKTVEDGYDIDKFLKVKNAIKGVDAKNEKGESVSGLKKKRIKNIIYSMNLTDKEKNYFFRMEYKNG